jgi:hypothetical protein
MKSTFFIIALFLFAQFSCKSLQRRQDSNNGNGLAPANNQTQGQQQGQLQRPQQGQQQVINA